MVLYSVLLTAPNILVAAFSTAHGCKRLLSSIEMKRSFEKRYQERMASYGIQFKDGSSQNFCKPFCSFPKQHVSGKKNPTSGQSSQNSFSFHPLFLAALRWSHATGKCFSRSSILVFAHYRTACAARFLMSSATFIGDFATSHIGFRTSVAKKKALTRHLFHSLLRLPSKASADVCKMHISGVEL